MHAWEAIQTTADYIEEHLAEEITIDELAKLAYLSPFYYQRLFSKLVKKPVREYIKYRRLAHAAALLPDKKRRILDIAVESGFNSHETFTRSFKEAFGITPEYYRESPVMLNQFDKPDLLLNYTMIDEGVPLISDGLIMEFKRHELTKELRLWALKDMYQLKGRCRLVKQQELIFQENFGRNFIRRSGIFHGSVMEEK